MDYKNGAPFAKLKYWNRQMPPTWMLSCKSNVTEIKESEQDSIMWTRHIFRFSSPKTKRLFKVQYALCSSNLCKCTADFLRYKCCSCRVFWIMVKNPFAAEERNDMSYFQFKIDLYLRFSRNADIYTFQRRSTAIIIRYIFHSLKNWEMCSWMPKEYICIWEKEVQIWGQAHK